MGHHPLQQPNGVSHVQILEHQIKTKFPNATQEQVMRMISDQLAKSVHQQQQRQGTAQSAMNAAAGVSTMNGMGLAGQGTPQLYAQMLRQQQENQQKQQQAQQQAANTVGGASGSGSGNAGQGHAHRGSSGSVQSGKWARKLASNENSNVLLIGLWNRIAVLYCAELEFPIATVIE
jgi:chromatin modification-related protein VID21